MSSPVKKKARLADCESPEFLDDSSDEIGPELEAELSRIEAAEIAASQPATRFYSPSKSLESYQKGFVPKNTQVNTQWALRNFTEWMRDYNSHHPDDPCCDDILLSSNSSELSYWLQKYVLGTRKQNGERYPPKTIYLLLCGLNRHMKEKKPDSLNIFDCENSDFKLLFNTCDSFFQELREDGVGNTSKATEAITRDDEEKLWSLGTLSDSSPKGLLNAVFFLNRKNFVLRGGAEHRCLKLSQLVRNVSPEGKLRYTYTENCSKNRAGGFNQLKVPNKVVHQYQDLGSGDRCHVYILDKYISKLPCNALKQDAFYLRPVVKMPLDVSAPWYTSVPIGKNPLSSMLKNMCKEANIPGNKTNHSLRAYAATEMFHAGIPEKVIQDRTGHRSLDGLRKYETISEKQKEEACKILAVQPEVSPQVEQVQENHLNMKVASYSQQPSFTCTLGSASLHGCTINIFQNSVRKDQ